MAEEDIVSRCRQVGFYFRDRLMWLKERHGIVKEVRGRGLMIGMELHTDGAPFVNACMEEGFLINCIQETVLRFVPPLTITRKQIDQLVECLDRLFGNMKEAA